MAVATQRLAIIDYGMGNLHSVASAVHKVDPDVEVLVTASADDIHNADRVIFPGVGAIRDCMAEIRRLNFDKLVAEAITQKPVLAICVGLQALMDRSEENDGVDCLGLLPGTVRYFGEDLLDDKGHRLKVPHMGWSRVEQSLAHPMWHNIDDGTRFYFVHSYYVDAADRSQLAGECEYGVRFAACLHAPNLFATQFHPEKSHTAGLQLLHNFIGWNGQL